MQVIRKPLATRRARPFLTKDRVEVRGCLWRQPVHAGAGRQAACPSDVVGPHQESQALANMLAAGERCRHLLRFQRHQQRLEQPAKRRQHRGRGQHRLYPVQHGQQLRCQQWPHLDQRQQPPHGHQHQRDRAHRQWRRHHRQQQRRPHRQHLRKCGGGEWWHHQLHHRRGEWHHLFRNDGRPGRTGHLDHRHD
ncbi:hypothetical protein B1S06_25880 (plasmid) [Rhodopseudomonas palustris]|uniref:Uncharacterized protein n=1 Tax=Rhodopseudomonas palustris (strain ATCC BAA-98 / CGA009) TaxID=258594 RepID=Q6NDV5_RHOPA|nr:hypothetical protein B1S06_25880 [Rhodopseudomonas palustris]